MKLFNVIAGFLLFVVCSVILFEGANDINVQYNNQIDQEWQPELTGTDALTFSSKINNLSDTNPAGQEGGTSLTTGSTIVGDAGFLYTLKSFFGIFSFTNDVKGVVNGDGTNNSGLQKRLNVDGRLTFVLISIFVLAIAMMLLGAFLKNKMEL